MPNLILDISINQLNRSKKEQAIFDSQKTHDKFKCKNNYIGYLGELVFNEYLKKTGLNYEWICYTKKNWDSPDFIVNNKSVDLKTTFSNSMWIQEEKFDTYIYAQINKLETQMEIIGWLSKQDITNIKKKKLCNIVKRGNRKDYVFKQSLMKDFLSYLN
jgi:hypothetical protein